VIEIFFLVKTANLCFSEAGNKIAGIFVRGYLRLSEVKGGYMRLLKKEAAYEKLKFYQDICEMRRLIYQITERFRKIHLRLVSQMRAAARSAKQNIREGYKRGTIGEFIRGINISLGSLEELGGDVEDSFEDGLITEEEFNKLSKLFRSANYMAGRYLKSLYKIEREGTWKTPGNRTGKK
jgi:four helix bundle protein